jgi:hypothetical protein
VQAARDLKLKKRTEDDIKVEQKSYNNIFIMCFAENRPVPQQAGPQVAQRFWSLLLLQQNFKLSEKVRRKGGFGGGGGAGRGQ